MTVTKSVSQKICQQIYGSQSLPVSKSWEGVNLADLVTVTKSQSENLPADLVTVTKSAVSQKNLPADLVQSLPVSKSAGGGKSVWQI